MQGEGVAIAALWRELWDAHQAWGGYPGSHDDAVYARVAARLDDDARVRAGRPLLGSHAHLIADLDGAPCGQVEGWIERQGWGASAPLTCEVRSLVVRDRARASGLGRALLDALEKTTLSVSSALTPSLAPEARCVLAAEVLEPNPAHGFYARVGFTPVAWNAGLDAAAGARLEGDASAPSFVARWAGAGDASAVGRLEGLLASRRREAGDTRFEAPRAVDAAVLTAIAAHLAAVVREQGDSATLVAVDRTGTVRGAASVVVQTLDPPFLPVRRALVGRFALDPGCAPAGLVRPLVALGCRFAESRGAARVELTDLTAPGTALHDAALALGARPWSRVVIRQSPVPCPSQPHG
jgi:GNAT superfamily N-acetyltransferase